MTKSKSSRRKGDDVEDKVLSFLEPYFSVTAGSGSVHKDGDLRNDKWVCEVKMRATAGASFAGADYKKLVSRAKMEGKDWLFVCQNHDRDLIAMQSLDTFSMMHEEMLIAQEIRREKSDAYERAYQRVKENRGRRNNGSINEESRSLFFIDDVDYWLGCKNRAEVAEAELKQLKVVGTLALTYLEEINGERQPHMDSSSIPQFRSKKYDGKMVARRPATWWDTLREIKEELHKVNYDKD